MNLRRDESTGIWETLSEVRPNTSELAAVNPYMETANFIIVGIFLRLVLKSN